MYDLQKIKISDWEQIPTLTQFYSDLAKKPYCTNNKGVCYPRTKANAVKHAYIQPNHPHIIKWLVFDIDNENALFSYHDNNLPPPQIIVKNPANGHAHYCYKLTAGVPMCGNVHVKPIEYLQAVYSALAVALGADLSYGGNLIKNPLNSQHETYLTGSQPSYSLQELADYLDLEPSDNKPRTQANEDYFGRNCAVFHQSRILAYRIADKYDYSQLVKEVLAIVEEHNARFDKPMLANECYHIAKSIARYCKSPQFKAKQAQYNAQFSRLQAQRGSNGGKVSKRPPVANSETTQQPWLKLGISRATYYNRKKLGKI